MNNKATFDVLNFQRLFEAAPDLYLVLSPELMIIGASDAYLNATMTRRADVMERHLFDVFPDNPDDSGADGVSNLRASLDRVLAGRQPDTMPLQKYDIRRPDGTFEERYWRPRNSPVLDEHGAVQYIIHRVEDATELVKMRAITEEQSRINQELEAAEKKHIENLKKSEERFFKIFNLSPVATYITDVSDGHFLYVNKAFEELFRMEMTSVIGKTVVELNIIDDEKRATVIQKINERGGRAKALEIDLRVGSGELKKMLVSTETIELEGKQCFLVALVDITERKKQHDAIVELNRELEAFSYSVSHDLRAPLRAVTGYSQMLGEDYSSVLDAEGKRLLQTISQNAERMGKLIDELLNFSRLGRKTLHLADTNMNVVTEEAITEINKSTDHHTRIKTGTLHSIRSDEALMRQVMINLLSNAIKYSSKKPDPAVEISSEESGGNIIFSVEDNGAGFDMKYVAKLFNVFQRLHSNDEFEGTGVGLAIVQRIVSKHGGKVWAEGRVGEGATIYFSIPKNQTI